MQFDARARVKPAVRHFANLVVHEVKSAFSGVPRALSSDELRCRLEQLGFESRIIR
jgi:hypothetical protein